MKKIIKILEKIMFHLSMLEDILHQENKLLHLDFDKSLLHVIKKKKYYFKSFIY
jgi:flagellar biosynthesis/type III secretory pathway chaperone